MKSITLSIEDRIVLFRLIVGVIFGLAVFILSFLVKPDTLSLGAFAGSILVYYLTTLYIVMKYRPSTRFQIYLRGLATFYSSWLLTAILLYELVGTLGLR
ncbi:MAG: hypothetical protein QXK88_00170 [Desulfurococcaceae archaeon]